jgi:D-alanyl-D-alanine carboxypeptidase (penicillin-binding protein 5/6)
MAGERKYDGGVPLSRRQILRRRRIVVFGSIAVLLATAFYLPTTLLAPLTPASATVVPYTAPTTEAAELDWPGYGASAIGAVGYDGVLGTSGSTKALPIASLSKVITALVVLTEKPLETDEAGPSISFTSDDVQIYNDYVRVNGKVEPVSPGMVLSERQVLEIVLVASANNYTQALVNWAFGSEDAYVKVANKWLAEHGLENTSMSDATGMSPQNRSTATDLVSLAKLALADPIVSEIVGTKKINIPAIGTITNTNDLLGIDGVKGIKTGTLDEAGACLLFTADYEVGGETITVVGVVLGGEDHPSLDRSIRKLLKTTFAGFQIVPLVTEGDTFGSYSTAWGDTSELVASATESVVVWAGTPISMAVSTSAVGLSEAGSEVGSITYTVGGETIAVPLELTDTIDDPGAQWRLTHPAELF